VERLCVDFNAFMNNFARQKYVTLLEASAASRAGLPEAHAGTAPPAQGAHPQAFLCLIEQAGKQFGAVFMTKHEFVVKNQQDGDV
jgi:hypothetical protein